MAVELQTPGVIKTRELIELFEKYGIKVGTKVGNASRLAGVYGIKKPKEVKVQYTGQSPITIKNPTQFYIKPTDSQLKQIKKQYDINQLKRTEGGPGKKAFEKRNKRAKQLLKTGKYTIGQANEKLKLEFPEIKKTGMQTTLSKLAKNIKGIPSGTTGDTSASIIKIKKDLEKLNKSEVKDLLKAGNKNLQSLINKTSKILGRDKSLATRRIGQLIEAYRGDDRYIKVKDDLLVRRVQPLIKGLGKIEGTKLFGGIGGGLQRMAAEGEVAKSIGETRSFFSSLRKRIQEALPKSGYETDEIKNIRSSARFGTGPYSMFVQGIRSDINQDKMKALDKQTSIYEKRLQAAKPEDKLKIAKEYNVKARKFALDANKNLKPGQPPVRVLEISFDEPNKVIKNKYALDNYGDLFDDIYQKHGYSFKVPTDIKTIEEVKPFLEGGRGLKKAAQLIRAGAPRIFGIPAAAYLGYQALGGLGGSAEAAEIQQSEVKQQLPSVPLKYDATVGSIVNATDDKKADQNQILEYVKDNPIKVAAGTSLGFAAEEIPGAYRTARGVGERGPLPKGKGRIRSALGISGALRPVLTTFGTPLVTGLFEGAVAGKRLDEGETMTEVLTDPLGPALGVSLMEPLSKLSGVVRNAPKRTMLEGAKNYFNLSNVGAARPGITGQILRMGMSPRTIAGASRFLGLPGVVLGAGLAGYDAYKNYQNKEGMIYNLFNKDE
jgi:hypothetical protein